MAEIHHEPERHEKSFDATPGVGNANLVNLSHPVEAARLVEQTADKHLAIYDGQIGTKILMGEDANLRLQASQLASFDNAKKLMVTSV